MAAYYNEIDHNAAQWLRNLIAAGHIAPGEVDERSIEDVQPDDLRGFTQVHMFAGIGGWSYALRLAGWKDDRPVWTGSCPCSPFSSAGKQEGFEDDRHLWPAFYDLIRECRPRTVFGEQVAGAGGFMWWDQVATDLEDADYAVAAANLGAHTVGSGHIRQRLYWVANSTNHGQGSQPIKTPARELQSTRCGEELLANSNSDELRATQGHQNTWADGRDYLGGRGKDSVLMGYTYSEGLQGWSNDAEQYASECAAGAASPWDRVEWIACTDGKSRPIELSICPLVDGLPKGLVRGGDSCMAQDANQTAEARTMRLRGYGNAIVPQVAALFIKACADSIYGHPMPRKDTTSGIQDILQGYPVGR